jgi:hypothetical protein
MDNGQYMDMIQAYFECRNNAAAALRLRYMRLYSEFFLRMNWSNNLSKKLRNSYNAMKRLLRKINI